MICIHQKQLRFGRFETWDEKPGIEFIQAKQVHGTDIVTQVTLPCDADGIMSSWENMQLPIAIKTADCMPIVIEGEKGVVFLHAGWKGLADGILLRSEVSSINPVFAYIGPSIRECCFEVSTEFKNNFPGSPFFSEKEGKLFFNLQEAAKAQLMAKFHDLKIEMATECTCSEKKFHSYRRDKTTLRNWNLYIKG